MGYRRIEEITRPLRLACKPYRRDLILLLLVAWGFRMIWVFVIPPWHVPDEAAHFMYTAYLVEQREVPYVAQTAQLPLYSTEVVTSVARSLYHQTSSEGTPNAPALTVLPESYDYVGARNYEAPDQERRSAGGATATPYSPLFYLAISPAYWLFRDAPVLSRLYALRLSVALLGAVSCLFAYLIGVTLHGTREWGRALGFSMAWFPQYAFISAGVNNDVGGILCATALIWLTLLLLGREVLNEAQVLLIGAVGALTVVAKPTALPIAAISGLTVLWLLGRRAWQDRRLTWEAPRLVMIYGFGVLAILSLQLVFMRYQAMHTAATEGNGSRLGSLAHGLVFSLGDYWYAKVQGGSNYLIWFYLKTGWGLFGWLDVPLKEEIYALIGFINIVGIAAVLLLFCSDASARGKLLIPLGIVLAQVIYLFLVIDYYVSFAVTGRPIGIQGRYLFPALAPILYLLIGGWYHFGHNHPRILRIAPLCVLALQLISLATMLNHFYGIGIA